MSYERAITAEHRALRKPAPSFEGIDNPASWLEKQTGAYQLTREDASCYLLAHADDGVIWGRIEPDGTLITSHDALKNSKDTTLQAKLPRLQEKTLQQARLFSRHGEVAIWRDGEGEWRGRVIINAAGEEKADWEDSFDEPYLLWGTYVVEALPDHFTLVADGQQGMYHAVPFSAGSINEATQLRLMTRHYLNQTGFAQVVASRLVSF